VVRNRYYPIRRVWLAFGTVPTGSLLTLLGAVGFGVGAAGPNRDLLVRRAATARFGASEKPLICCKPRLFQSAKRVLQYETFLLRSNSSHFKVAKTIF
jgi:hypothetical protein